MILTCKSRYASGRTTGIVLDSGDGVTHAVPVFEGFSMPSAIRRVDIAGRDVTEHLQLLLRKAGYQMHTSAEKEVIRMVKEKVCYVALNPAKEEKETGGKGEEFKLPDGNSIKASHSASFLARMLTVRTSNSLA
jgi:centractin